MTEDSKGFEEVQRKENPSKLQFDPTMSMAENAWKINGNRNICQVMRFFFVLLFIEYAP